MTLSIALAAPLAALQMTSPPTEAGAFYWADFNADGHTDAYVVLPEGEARLLAGKGEGAFSDITLEAGLDRVRGVHQIAWADLDGDRRLDLFLASYSGKSRVLLQQEGGSFAPVHDDRGLWADSRPLDVRALDLDGDQRADLQLITPEGDVLLRSLGGGAFERLELGFRTIAPETDLSGLNVGRARAEAGLPDVGPDRPAMEKSTNPGIGLRSTPPAPGTVPFCPPSVQDVATGNCIPASSVPM
ncbi:MAG: FG-GAP repeat domain-containing protein, partial [Planctomycetota bacterium]